ncbi:hypothetical protein PHYSODRAFT_518156 [Phytophthora sojae]|uniref:EF-hand domain-containing protein n=1 Tax=Phytophthora sojae (strain P6497) TaxID=1094619 RepID=G4ZYH9_PHYSP|nr:hypothetical protein PHYSODRAFT_518156 [Phytophthora sojae]EGZ12738.1 hypothetical protein PHYSODRAFT_518156 [Phytophthora sojae]|eukprot:XP_009533071.1 hypothetical protein PHYSODRAFT_518156 [Phytophthora sojae]
MAGTSLFRVGDVVELWRVLLHLSVLVVCLLLFERALHLLERRAAVSAKYEQLLSKAYRELMILGLIGLGLKLVKEAPSVDGGSATITAFQVADLTIFILALALILQTVCIFLRLRKHNVRADRAELLSTEDLADAVVSATSSQARDVQELVHLRLLRHLFLARFDLPQLFPFSKYLRQAQNNQITHMTDVGAPMWALLLAVAWSLEGITDILQHSEPDLPRRRSLVIVLVGFAWALLTVHVAVLVYFRSCVQQLLKAAGMAADPPTLESHLRVIAREEARAWTKEDAGQALLTMQKSSLVPEAVARIDIRWFSRRSWHFIVMLLLMLNGFYLALVAQCVAYQIGIVYEDSGLAEVLAIPLPLVLNTLILQPPIFRNLVLVSSIFRVDGTTLNEVVNHFREIVELRSEFAASLWNSMQAKTLSIGDLQTELEACDPGHSGAIDIENMRLVLRRCGFHLSSFRFNSLARLLFELNEMQIEYAQLLKLIELAQTEICGTSAGVHPSMPVYHHPLLRQSVLGEEDEGTTEGVGNSYLPPHPLLASMPVDSSISRRTVVVSTRSNSFLPPRPQLGRSDSKFQGVSSRALCDLFHIDCKLDPNVPTPTVDCNFAHV